METVVSGNAESGKGQTGRPGGKAAGGSECGAHLGCNE